MSVKVKAASPIRADVLGALAAATLLLVLAGWLALGREARAADPCPNAEFRTGPSAKLPGCRAYELVTPRDTNGSPVYGPTGYTGFATGYFSTFASPPARDDGRSLMYATQATPIPALGGTGYGNQYRALRTADGWESELRGPTGSEVAINRIGGFSADHSLGSFLASAYERDTGGVYGGSLDLLMSPKGYGTTYAVGPNREFTLVGEGTLPASPDSDGNQNGLSDELSVEVMWISDHGDHVIFRTRGGAGGGYAAQLLPEAPPTGTDAVYDRTPTGLKLISLLPGDVTPTDNSTFAGASLDGEVVLFTPFATGVEPQTLYARIGNQNTIPVAGPATDIEPNGLSDDGDKVFYRRSGNLYRFDTSDQTTSTITSSGDARFVNVAGDGSRAYFISNSQLDGAEGVLGQPNLYVWDGVDISFIATVDPDDLSRQPLPNSQSLWGLTQWGQASGGAPTPGVNGGIRQATSRLTSDGKVIAFESKARLTEYDNDGHFAVYRYDTSTDDMTCVSCGSFLSQSGADSFLTENGEAITGIADRIPSLRADGDALVFQSDDALVPGDSNGMTDVYYWESGAGISLISTGRDANPSFVRGADPAHDSIFFSTGQQLVPKSQERGVLAVYVARINGGLEGQFEVDRAPGNCVDDDCQDDPSGSPADEEVGSDGDLAGNVKAPAGDCSKIARLRKAAQTKARRLGEKAADASGKRAKRLRKKAAKQKRQVKRLRRDLEQCRRTAR